MDAMKPEALKAEEGDGMDRELLSPAAARSSGAAQASHANGVGAAAHQKHEADAEPAEMESLDYEMVESSVYKQHQAERGLWDAVIYGALKWVLALLLGIGTALAAFVINVAVENFAGWKFAATFWVMQYTSFFAFFLYTAFNAALVYSSAFVITHFAPAAAGSGIPEIKGYLNGIDYPGILLLRTLGGKVLGSIGSVAGGLALGKEGPLVHTGACIASLLGQGGSTKYRITSRWLKLFKNDRDRRDLVTCGSAAGAAAAFRAPVGGVLFALEELTSWWRSHLMWRVFFTSAVVTVVLRGLMRWCSQGNCGHFGSGGFILWDVHGGQDDYAAFELVPMAMLGVLGGLLGALFNQLTYHLSAFRRGFLHTQGAQIKIYEACAVSILTSVLSFGLPLITPCTPCPDPKQFPDIVCPRPTDNYGNFVNFYCSKDMEYNEMATIFFNTQDDAIRNLFSARTFNEYSAHTLILFLVVFYLLAVLTYGIAVPAGQFVPGIMIGATYGRIMGVLMVKMYGQDVIDEGTYALLGAASFLGGSMRMTVSLCVIMVEISNNLTLLPLFMLVLLISKAVGDGFNPGLYDLQAALRQIPILDTQPKRFMRSLRAMDAASSDVVKFARVEQVKHIVEVLKETNHNGFPVIETLPTGGTLFIGLILRSHLLVLLRSRARFQHSAQPDDTRGMVPVKYDITDFSKAVSSKGIAIHDIALSPAELRMHLDLKPFLNPNPYTAPEDMSLTKVYVMFRQLGLRHVCIIPRPPRVLGVITRKDLLPEILEERMAEAAAASPNAQSGATSPRLLRRSTSATRERIIEQTEPENL